ncbi:MAG TPA: agmatine deiminase family protein [bacterium]|nr:agmatine deiminase family protein [bacterium]
MSKSLKMKKTPRQLGFAMPPEWAPHAGTWLSYPHNPTTFYAKMDSARNSYVEMIGAVAAGETVHVNVNDDDTQDELEARLKKKGIRKNVVIHQFPTNDAWCRDHGAIFVKQKRTGEVAATCWVFTSWGGKYPHILDQQIPYKMAGYLKKKYFATGLAFEGGSIDVNGAGVLLTTEQCLLNPNRNPHLDKKEIEGAVKDYLGVDKIVWLGEGVAGDDTDGHVDDIARFVNRETILAVYENNKKDENYEPLKENYEKLLKATDCKGKRFAVVKLPMPDPVYFEEGRLPASYANFYISNAAVVVPTFDCDQDLAALETIRNYFPDRRVVGIPASDVVVGLGTFHCLSQQIPS